MELGAFMGVFDPLRYAEFAVEAEQLGCESVWLPEHLILPTRQAGAPGAPPASGQEADDHPHLPSDSPLADPFVALAHIAAMTSTIRLGTCVFVPGLRHPFVVARSVGTLDLLSGGRVDLGVGAGWHRAEWEATEVPFGSRGTRLDETIDICRSLWRDPVTTFDGAHFRFEEVEFQPKPVQPGGPPIHVGGSSRGAFERAARRGDGWLPMDQTPDSIVYSVQRLTAQRHACGRGDVPFEVTVPCTDLADIDRWRATGIVDRIVVGCERDADATMELIRAAAAAMQ